MTIYQGKKLTTQSFYDMNQYLREKRIAEVIKYIQRHPILDVGCGEGESTALLSRYFVDVVGIDNNPESLKKAKELHPKLTFKCAEIHNIPTEYRTVHCGHVIEHVNNPYRFLTGCYEIIPDKGRIIVTTPNAKSLHKRVGDLMGLSLAYELSFTDNEQGHKHVFDMNLLEKFVRGVGFEIIHKQGLMLKPFPSSMMWDLIDVEMMDAFFEVGRDPAMMEYCSSIMIVGEKKE